MLVRHDIDFVQDDAPVRGHALASGDDAEDKRVEDAIIGRLNQVDIYAWCTAIVTLTLMAREGSPASETFKSEAFLGACSYANRKEALEDLAFAGYAEVLTREALGNLRVALRQAVSRGKAAEKMLAEFDEEKLVALAVESAKRHG